MNRNDFLKTCVSGLCGCSVLGFLARADAHAEETSPAPVLKVTDVNMLQRKLNTAQERFAKLMTVLQENVDEATQQKILQNLGRKCAGDYLPALAENKINVRGFLAEMRSSWVEKTEYDEAAGTVRIVGKQSQGCCPLAKPGVTPSLFCACSLGHMQAVFSFLLNKPVNVDLEDSILRGGKSCVFRIRTI